MRSDKYQIALIGCGIIATLLTAVFFYRELFPEYKVYQNRYMALEEFRSSYTGQPLPPFRYGIKQIIKERKDKGPVAIDRCTSCHVALQLSHFSPTKIAKNVNGEIILDEEGIPKKVANENYVFAKLDEKIADSHGREAEKLEALKVIKVGEHTYDAAKVLTMHPLIGRETRPFELHPIDEYGCTSCHGGNGRGLTTQKAHGPVYDGQYEMEDIGPEPKFTEPDEKNDPKFSKVFNGKPGHKLLFQTTPILVGSLIEANCMQCHQSSKAALHDAVDKAQATTEQWLEKSKRINASYSKDLDALVSLLNLRHSVDMRGVAETVSRWQKESENYRLPEKKRTVLAHQAKLLTAMVGGWDGLRTENAQPARDVAIEKIQGLLEESLGSKSLAEQLSRQVDSEGVDIPQIVNQFIFDHKGDKDADGEVFIKARAVDKNQETEKNVKEQSASFKHEEVKIHNDVDKLTARFHEGEELFISQACYACHRISGFTRGGIGPELTEIGDYYPWYIKQSIVWPQADLKTSTMPNYRLDHEELEGLVTFLLAQRGQNKAVSVAEYKTKVQEWEAGKKTAIEKPITPAKQHDLRYAMTVFATEGCAACHRLEGFKSNVGFAIEKESPDFNQLYMEREWFKRVIPESITGSELVEVLETNGEAFDKRIVDGVRQDGLIEEIEAKFPGNTESFYSNFKYAARAQNHALEGDELKAWNRRVHQTLMMYVQIYGYGRLIGPKPNWSGVYRSDKWLMEHFWKPSSLIARSIMPVFPFDNTKFYALTNMLDVLGERNRNANRKVWQERGFNPEVAYELYCAQCHGDMRVGNGPVAEWIYPVPKNLRNADFLRNLTRQRVFDSISHGVKGTPMPPWGEVAKDKPMDDSAPVLSDGEIAILTDWLYSTLPGGTVIQEETDVPKWQYEPENVIEELKNEGSDLKIKQNYRPDITAFPKGDKLFASLEPNVSPKVEVVFDVEKSFPGKPDPYSYYIKKKYYTPENLDEGRAFFELNCAVCHGREGDGAGDRASVMVDAKPRMLTNLDWLDTRDDLRLLRSIKYGVLGTSMTPWGDQTTSLKRLQLVMYIRTLSEEQKERDRLFTALYNAFDRAEIIVENARKEQFEKIVSLQENQDKLQRQERELRLKGSSPSEAAQVYEQSLRMKQELTQKESVDRILQELRGVIQQEKMLYQGIGMTLLSQRLEPELMSQFVQLIEQNNEAFSLKNGKLSYQFGKQKQVDEFYEVLKQKIESKLNKRILQKTFIEGRIASPGRQEELENINSKINSLTNLRNILTSNLEEAKRLRERERELVESFNKQK